MNAHAADVGELLDEVVVADAERVLGYRVSLVHLAPVERVLGQAENVQLVAAAAAAAAVVVIVAVAVVVIVVDEVRQVDVLELEAAVLVRVLGDEEQIVGAAALVDHKLARIDELALAELARVREREARVHRHLVHVQLLEECVRRVPLRLAEARRVVGLFHAVVDVQIHFVYLRLCSSVCCALIAIAF